MRAAFACARSLECRYLLGNCLGHFPSVLWRFGFECSFDLPVTPGRFGLSMSFASRPDAASKGASRDLRNFISWISASLFAGIVTKRQFHHFNIGKFHAIGFFEPFPTVLGDLETDANRTDQSHADGLPCFIQPVFEGAGFIGFGDMRLETNAVFRLAN